MVAIKRSIILTMIVRSQGVLFSMANSGAIKTMKLASRRRWQDCTATTCAISSLEAAALNIGDGGMTYGGEKNMETYYKLGLSKNLDLTADYQFFMNPGHNAARGPVNVFSLRVRGDF